MQPAGLGAGVDAHGDELLDRARGEAVAADLLAGEGGLLQQQHVEPGAGQVGTRRSSRRAGADDDDVGVVRRAGARSGGCCALGCRARLGRVVPLGGRVTARASAGSAGLGLPAVRGWSAGSRAAPGLESVHDNGSSLEPHPQARPTAPTAPLPFAPLPFRVVRDRAAYGSARSLTTRRGAAVRERIGLWTTAHRGHRAIRVGRCPTTPSPRRPDGAPSSLASLSASQASPPAASWPRSATPATGSPARCARRRWRLTGRAVVAHRGPTDVRAEVLDCCAYGRPPVRALRPHGPGMGRGSRAGAMRTVPRDRSPRLVPPSRGRGSRCHRITPVRPVPADREGGVGPPRDTASRARPSTQRHGHRRCARLAGCSPPRFSSVSPSPERLARALDRAGRVRHCRAMRLAIGDIAGGAQALSEIDAVQVLRVAFPDAVRPPAGPRGDLGPSAVPRRRGRVLRRTPAGHRDRRRAAPRPAALVGRPAPPQRRRPSRGEPSCGSRRSW